MTHYQIALFSNGADSLLATLRATITRRITELGIDSSHIAFLDDSTLASRDPKAPIVGAYLSPAPSPPTLRSVADLFSAGTMIVPAVPDLYYLSSYVFDEIRKINGIAFSPDDPGLESIAAVPLEDLGLLRKARRPFIS
jgi:hypothetical protein